MNNNQWRIQEFLKGGADEKNQAKEGADGTKMQTFRRILLGKSEKSNPKGGAAAPTASPLDPPLIIIKEQKKIFVTD